MRTIGVVTTSRADYGIYLPILRRIKAEPELKLHLYVTGMHLSPEFGYTVDQIVADGFTVDTRVEMLLSGDTPGVISKSMGIGTMGFAQAFSQFKPDILVVLGDRYEMFSAALAALPFKIPLAHIHGGEVTQGAIDDALRHAMTKLSHLHFVSTEVYKQRVIQMGESPWRVTISGAPGLDNLKQMKLLSRQEFSDRYQIPLDEPFLLVTYHPVTLEYENTAQQIGELLAALDQVGYPVVFTLPNADTNGRVIIDNIRQYQQTHANNAYIVENFGTQGYFSCMAYAAAMVGNSSSGIVEAASFKLPVVNIGSRQKGRAQAANVCDVDYSQEAILAGIKRVLAPAFRQTLLGLENPYGDGESAERIVRVLQTVERNQSLIQKSFHDFAVTT